MSYRHPRLLSFLIVATLALWVGPAAADAAIAPSGAGTGFAPGYSAAAGSAEPEAEGAELPAAETPAEESALAAEEQALFKEEPAASAEGPATGSEGSEAEAESGVQSEAPNHSQKSATPRISTLRLSSSTVSALRHSHPRADQIAFSFNANAAARVKVNLDRAVLKSGRRHWQPLALSLAFNARPGRDRATLRSRMRLAPGSYRLTLRIARSSAHSLTFRVHR